MPRRRPRSAPASRVLLQADGGARRHRFGAIEAAGKPEGIRPRPTSWCSRISRGTRRWRSRTRASRSASGTSPARCRRACCRRAARRSRACKRRRATSPAVRARSSAATSTTCSRSRDEWAFFVGDVCGKGAEAAALTAMVRYTLRAEAIHRARPARGPRPASTRRSCARSTTAASAPCCTGGARIEGGEARLRLASAGPSAAARGARGRRRSRRSRSAGRCSASCPRSPTATCT